MVRTGFMFAFENFCILPVVLTLGKALGGGMPIGALVSSQKNLNEFTYNPMLGHITTFGGHPVCAAAALANLQQLIVRRDEWNVAQKEEAFRNLLVHPLIERVTGRGLLLACHIHPNIDIIALNKVLLSQGVFTDWFLFNAHAIRIAPPLIINLTDIHRVCEVILSSLNFFQNKIGG
jgi:acetylornithine/succinyldiaminopimelate/putrescine aminotransferase